MILKYSFGKKRFFSLLFFMLFFLADLAGQSGFSFDFDSTLGFSAYQYDYATQKKR